MNAMPPQRPLPIREIDVMHYVKHYINLFWRWKWWVLISTPIVFIVSTFYFFKLSPLPELTASVLIGLENNSNIVDGVDFSNMDNSKAGLIKTRNFLKNIVEQLSLRMNLKDFPRSSVFSTVIVDSMARDGKYIFKIDRENRAEYIITFSNRRMGFSDEVVTSGVLARLDALKLPGIYLQFSQKFLKDPYEFKFYISPMSEAIEYLHRELNIEKPDIRQQRYNIEVSLKGRDYDLIARILNAIADAFVEKKMMFKKRRTESVLGVLEKQYEKAKSELNKSENRLRYFRSANPTVGLNQGTRQTLNTMIEEETASYTIKDALKESMELRVKIYKASDGDRTQIAREVFVFLKTHNNTAAPVLQSELERLMEEKRRLQQNYSDNHPLLKKNSTEISRLMEKTKVALSSYISELKDKISKKQGNIESLSQKLRQLPSKELQLAELQRQHNVNAEIYSKVLDRYNQLKLSENVEVPDTYIMDYAVAPIPPPVNIMKIFALCMMLSICIGLAPPVLFDMFDKTVRTEFELKKISDIPVLESIPEIIPIVKKNEKK